MTTEPVARTTYSRSQMALHWLVVAGVLFQIAFHDFIVESRAVVAAGLPVSPVEASMALAHMISGSLIGMAVAARLALRRLQGVPPHQQGKSALSARLADAMHFGLYAALAAMVVTGWITASGLANLGGVHFAINVTMVLMIFGHAGAAFWNQFVLKDGTLSRMLPKWRAPVE